MWHASSRLFTLQSYTTRMVTSDWVWISWSDQTIAFGMGTDIDENVVVVYNDPSPISVNFLALSSSTFCQWAVPIIFYGKANYKVTRCKALYIIKSINK